MKHMFLAVYVCVFKLCLDFSLVRARNDGCFASGCGCRFWVILSDDFGGETFTNTKKPDAFERSELLLRFYFLLFFLNPSDTGCKFQYRCKLKIRSAVSHTNKTPWNTSHNCTLLYGFLTYDSWRLFFPSARQQYLAEWLAGLSCLHAALPCQFFHRETTRFLHDSGQPQTAAQDLPFSSSSSSTHFSNSL